MAKNLTLDSILVNLTKIWAPIFFMDFTSTKR